jgi:4-aminobutyrate aminotransferase-like enzyme
MSNWSFDLTPKKTPHVLTRWRRIHTLMPAPESLPMFSALDKTESVSMHGQMPIVWDKAEGCQISDPWGNTWIDFTSTIFVANAGHGHPKIVKAIRDCLDKPLLHTYSYANSARVAYLKALIDAAPAHMEKAFLLSAGTEATECALKLMRMNGQKHKKRRLGIICFEGNWHGRTLGAQMMGYNPKQKEWIGYLDPNIHHLPFPYPWRDIKDSAKYFEDSFALLCKEKDLDPDQDICGFMLETFQGWAAAFYPPEFVQAIRHFADQIGALLAFDEMQSGFGRTGKFFGFEHYGVKADILCCGKGISSSLPLSAVISSREIMDLPDVGSMSSTHSANPVTCAAAHANLNIILEEKLSERSALLGEHMHRRLRAVREKFPECFSHVLGKGLLAGLHFNTPDGSPLSGLATDICERAMRKGLILVHTGRESIKIGPPLTIPEEALDEGLDVLEECIFEASAAIKS